MAILDIDGRAVAYDEAGGGDAPPLLLVHGFTGGRDDFSGVLPALADGRGGGRRVVAPDLPGHGEPGGDRSEPLGDDRAHSLSRLASWVLSLADALQLGEFHLLGHSLGGLVAQHAAALGSHRLRSLVLMDTGLGAVRDELAEWFARIAVTARDQGLAAAFELTMRPRPGHPAPVVDEEERRRLRARFTALDPGALIGEARALGSALPLGPFLRGIDIPVLVIHGADDAGWTPSEQALLARTVLGAERVIVPDSAHSPQQENRGAWLSAVCEFLVRADDGTGLPPRRRAVAGSAGRR